MTITKTDARQLISRDTLDQISGVAGSQLDDLFRATNSELTTPLRLTPSSTPNLVVNIGNIVVTNPDTNRNRTVPPISNTTPAFTTGTVTFPSSNGGNIVPSSGANLALVCPSGQFTRVGINLNAAGQITLTQGAAGASLSAATAAPVPSNTLPLGFIAVHNTAGTIDNITNSMIYQYGTGGGGSGSGNASSTLETYKNMFVDSPYNLLTPTIISTDGTTLISSLGGTAVNDLTNGAIKFVTPGDTMTSVQLLDATEYLAAPPTDIGSADVAVEWIAGSVDTGATYQISRDGGTHYQTITMSRVGLGTNTYRGEYVWLREDEDAANQTATATTTNNVILTNNSGTKQAVAQKFTTTVTTRFVGATVNLSKTATAPAGNYRISIYNDNGSGVPGSIVAAGAYTATTSITTTTPTASAYSMTCDVTVAAGTYYVVVETDDTYKAGTTSSNTANVISVHGDTTTGTNAYAYNFGWSSLATTTFADVLTANQESFGTSATYAVSNATTTDDLDDGTARAYLSQAFTLANASVIKRVQVYMNKTQSSGTLSGNAYVAIYNDNSGTPGTTNYGESPAIAMSSISTGNQTVIFDIPNLTLPAGTYHIVLRSDGAYKSSYSVGVRSLAWRTDGTTHPVPGNKSTNGTTWTTLTHQGTYIVDGRTLDLRLKITSSIANTLMDSFGVFYYLSQGQVVGGTKKRQKFVFNANTDNTNSFTISSFTVDPDLLRVYHAETGQVYVYPAFVTQGQTVTFPINTFFQDVSQTVTLIFDQNDGSGFNTSDSNGSLLAANHLGSTDGTIDRSVAGRGIILRRPDGTLREISINNSDQITILSVP